jgi:hypothetical protein
MPRIDIQGLILGLNYHGLGRLLRLELSLFLEGLVDPRGPEFSDSGFPEEEDDLVPRLLNFFPHH